MEYAILVTLVVAFLVVAPILGSVAFFRVRELQRRVVALEAELAGTSRGPWEEAGQEVDWQAEDVEPETPDEVDSAEALADNGQPWSAQDSTADEPQLQPETGSAGSDLEQTVGAKWAVWVGGLALALGGVFLVRYSIEQGLLGPGARILLGALFSLTLVAAGEWMRRRGAAYSIGGFESANVPAVLTAAGTLGGFATIYAAYQLYGFLGPFAAFFGLGAVAIATMVTALLHGPLLAALGIVASFLVPFLVSSDEPSVLGLAGYAIAVAAAGFGVGRLRLWRWLAVVAALGLVFFGLVLLEIGGSGDRPVVGLYILFAWAAIFFVFVASLYPMTPAEPAASDRMAVTLLGLVLLLSLVFMLARTDTATVAALLLVVAVPFASAWQWPAMRHIVPLAAVVAALGYAGWEFETSTWVSIAGSLQGTGGIDPETLPGFRQRLLSVYGMLGLVTAIVAAVLGIIGSLGSTARVSLAFGGTFVPVAFLAISYARTDFLDVSLRYGALALLLAAAFTILAAALDRRLSEAAGRDGVIAAYLIAATASLTLCLCIVLERGALTVALALVAPAVAFVNGWRPLPALRILALVPAVLWLARIAWDPTVVGPSLGDTPVFNWITYGYGVPALGFVLTAHLLGRQDRDIWLDIAEAVAVASVTGALALIGLHALEPQAMFTPIDTLSEAALLVFLGGGVALGLLRIKRTASSPTLRGAADVLGVVGMIGAMVGLLGVYNPLITGESVGTGIVFNKLLFAYLLTGLLYAALGVFSPASRPFYARSAFAVGGILVFAWVTLTIRHWFHPQALDVPSVTDPELYTYSAAWLLIGIATLAAGMGTGVRALRLFSGIIIVIVVAKVFLIDMASLTGALRAVSFIGLGIVLVAIGLVYQRLLRRQA